MSKYRKGKSDGDSWRDSQYHSLYRSYYIYLYKGLNDIWGSYKAFKAWSLATDWKPGMVLDSKEPRWTTKSELGKRNSTLSNKINKFVEVGGIVYELPKAVKKFTCLSYAAVKKRYCAGWQSNILYDPLTGFTKPVRVIK